MGKISLVSFTINYILLKIIFWLSQLDSFFNVIMSQMQGKLILQKEMVIFKHNTLICEILNKSWLIFWRNEIIWYYVVNFFKQEIWCWELHKDSSQDYLPCHWGPVFSRIWLVCTHFDQFIILIIHLKCISGQGSVTCRNIL